MKKFFVNIAAFFLRNMPFHRARKKYAKIFGPLFKGEIAKTAYGFPMIVNWHDNMNRISFEGSYGIVEEFIRTINEKSLFIDIGANHGCISILASKYLEKKGLVMAFEPSPKAFNGLKKNIKLNQCKNIFYFNQAISDTTGDLYLNETNTENSGAAHISDKGTKIKASPIKLKDIKAIVDLKNIYIKIDTEGYEMSVLNGLQELFNANLVRKLVIEIDELNLMKYDANSKKIYNYLNKYGFKPTIGLKNGHYDEVFVKND